MAVSTIHRTAGVAQLTAQEMHADHPPMVRHAERDEECSTVANQFSGMHQTGLRTPSPIVGEEDPVGPALAGPREQLLCQVQSWLVCILWKDDMAVPAASIRHAAHQLGLQLPTHTLHSCRQTQQFPISISSGNLQHK